MTLEVASPSELHVPCGSHILWIHASDKRRAEKTRRLPEGSSTS